MSLGYHSGCLTNLLLCNALIHDMSIPMLSQRLLLEEVAMSAQWRHRAYIASCVNRANATEVGVLAVRLLRPTVEKIQGRRHRFNVTGKFEQQVWTAFKASSRIPATNILTYEWCRTSCQIEAGTGLVASISALLCSVWWGACTETTALPLAFLKVTCTSRLKGIRLCFDSQALWHAL